MLFLFVLQGLLANMASGGRSLSAVQAAAGSRQQHGALDLHLLFVVRQLGCSCLYSVLTAPSIEG